METFINITGSGINSKLMLLTKLDKFDDQVTKLPFVNFKVRFKTKKEAVKALSGLYKRMKSDYTTYKYGEFVAYDSGIAQIENK